MDRFPPPLFRRSKADCARRTGPLDRAVDISVQIIAREDRSALELVLELLPSLILPTSPFHDSSKIISRLDVRGVGEVSTEFLDHAVVNGMKIHGKEQPSWFGNSDKLLNGHA